MGKRIYCNIKDFNSKDFDILREVGFTTIQRGVVVYHGTKIGLDQLGIMKKNIKILSKYVPIKNSIGRGNCNHTNKYQVLVWCKLIKREHNIPLKTLIGVFTALNSIQSNKEYKIKYSNLFIERINKTTLSEDWKDRFIRTVK